jgi:hypothetical protein
MPTRREFLKTAAATGLLRAGAAIPLTTLGQHGTAAASGRDDRQYWLNVTARLATPVLGHLARHELRKAMPVETFGDAAKLQQYTHLEAVARLLVGIAPWLAAPEPEGEESKLHRQITELAQSGLDAATDPKSPDFMNFSQGQQPLVDTAFLAQAILRAPAVLWKPLEPRVQRQLVEALKASRAIKPIGNNHILFSAAIEAALLEIGEPTVEERLEGYVRQMLGWYAGDGVYADGPYLRCDYYNSFVIHPTLVDVLGALRRNDSRFEPAYSAVLRRSRRYADIQERFIAPDGSYPAVGRSLTYRFGAFQTLAQMALLHELPERLAPAQVRCALTAVIRRTLQAPGTFDESGWLRVGLCGSQVPLGETYISTGSLYLCSVGLLPLGLPAAAAFWRDPPARWTSQHVWSGEALPADRALRDDRAVEVPSLKRESKLIGR